MKKKILVCMLFGIGLLSCVFAADGIQQIIYDDGSNVVGDNQTSFVFATDLGYTLINLHMMIGFDVPMSGNFSDINYLQLIYELKNNSSYNVMDLLEFEQDKRTVMDHYLHLLDISLLKADVALSNLKEDMFVLQGDLSYCKSSKQQSDRAYLDSVNAIYESQLMTQSLQDSLKYGQCISDKNIQYNAKKLLSDKIIFYRSILKVKYDYLSQNNDLIVDHYDLIRDTLLQKLLSIKNMLERYGY